MTGQEVINWQLSMADAVFYGLLDGISDEDLFIRTSPKANHLAWQIGHLIKSEHALISTISADACPALPEGFSDAHDKGVSNSDSREGFLTKDEYAELYKTQREATVKFFESLSDHDLDADPPQAIVDMFGPMIPKTWGIFGLQSFHQMWHVGQITSLRRQLALPNVF